MTRFGRIATTCAFVAAGIVILVMKISGSIEDVASTVLMFVLLVLATVVGFFLTGERNTATPRRDRRSEQEPRL